jgi:hypothetical protein
MNDLAAVAYDIIAIVEIGILEYVIRQVDLDRLNNLDPPSVRWARRGTFTGSELFLCFSMYSAGWLWQPSWMVVGLNACGALILAVNIISLHLRSPPRHQSGYRASAAHSWWRPRRG